MAATWCSRPRASLGCSMCRARRGRRSSPNHGKPDMHRAVIIDAVRTPIGRYGGALKSCRPDDLAALVLKTVVQRAKIDPALIEDIYLGAANQAGEDNRNVARM